MGPGGGHVQEGARRGQSPGPGGVRGLKIGRKKEIAWEKSKEQGRAIIVEAQHNRT